MLLDEPGPSHNFKKLVERMLPAYSDLLSYEYHTGPLLRNNNMCLDLAFPEAVWRYSRKMSVQRFPCGDFKPAIPFVSGPVVAVEASSSSSSAKKKIEAVAVEASSSSSSAKRKSSAVAVEASSSSSSAKKKIPVVAVKVSSSSSSAKGKKSA